MGDPTQAAATRALQRTGALALAFSLIMTGATQVARADEAQGGSTAAREADGISKALVDKSLQESDPDLSCILARNAGTLIAHRCSFTKNGDTLRPSTGLVSSTNACVAAQGEGSAIVLGQTAMATAGDEASGIVADYDARALVYQTRVTTTESGSRGIAAANGGTTLGSNLTIATNGRQSPGIEAGAGTGKVSLTNSTVTTSGTRSPVADVRGRMDLMSVRGAATQSAIATVEDDGSLLVLESDLASERTGTGSDRKPACGIDIQSERTEDGTECARVVALRSHLRASMSDGAMFWVRGAASDILLDGSSLEFDSASCSLVQAQGGADARLVARGMELAGNATASGASTANVFLADDTTWVGTPSAIREGDEDGSVSVHVDATSNWVVPASCTVRDLTVEGGGAIVDERGRTVSVEADGRRVTTGTSDVVVSVTGAYGTSLDLPSFAREDVDTIDRAEFDDEFGTQTAISTRLVTQPHTPMAPSAIHTSAPRASLLDIFIDWLKQTMGV